MPGMIAAGEYLIPGVPQLPEGKGDVERDLFDVCLPHACSLEHKKNFRRSDSINEHQHDWRYRICTDNNPDALVEDLTAAFLETQRHRTMDDHPWDKTEPY